MNRTKVDWADYSWNPITSDLYFLDLARVSRLWSGNMNEPTYYRWFHAMDRTRDYRWPK